MTVVRGGFPSHPNTLVLHAVCQAALLTVSFSTSRKESQLRDVVDDDFLLQSQRDSAVETEMGILILTAQAEHLTGRSRDVSHTWHAPHPYAQATPGITI